MDHIELLAESIIELEDIKQEQDESVVMPVSNSTELETNTVKSEVNEEYDDDDEVLERPVAIFLEEVAQEEVEWVEVDDEEEEPLLYRQDDRVGSESKDRNSSSLGRAHAPSDPGAAQSACTCTSDGKAANQMHVNLGAKLLAHRPCKKCSAENNRNVPTQNHTPVLYKCSVCQEGFTQSEHLAAHQRIHLRGKVYNCLLCQISFKCSQNLLAHMRRHTGEEPHKCLVCEKTFRGPLALHMRTHTDERSQVCFACKKSFRTRNDLDWHMQVHAQDRSHSQHFRPIYPKGVLVPAKITPTQTHSEESHHCSTPTQTHSGESHRCSVCQKSFKRREQLVNHMLLHSGNRRHPCSVCKMRFTRREHLDRHMRVHTGERPHCCSICQKSFMQSDNLVKHMRIHSGERPHVCLVCAKRFAQRSVLVMHMQTHVRKTISSDSELRV